jgi:hypothetical protein
MAASPWGKQQSGTAGCREYTLIFASKTAPWSRASACVLVLGAARMRHFLAKERAGNAGSWRASERLSPKNTDASSVISPAQGTPFGLWAEFPSFFRNAGENEDSHETDSHGTRDRDATPSPGGGAVGVP